MKKDDIVVIVPTYNNPLTIEHVAKDVLDHGYTLIIVDDGSDIAVQDWLHLQEDGVIINHSKMKKFGFVVGELVITIIKD